MEKDKQWFRESMEPIFLLFFFLNLVIKCHVP